ncbi:MAG: hypothetical protein K2W82_14415 [Candidatus Obscuribacterales bacterium]|nr:hypothetical protein [Candidatus Obscuribacterales bacterium]
MKSGRFVHHIQNSKDDSPRSLNERLLGCLFEYIWLITCAWTPRPFNPWRLFWLRLFGASLRGKPFVHQRARIEAPWNLILGDGSCLGDRSHIYNLARIEIDDGATIAQEAYLCSGSHDFSDPSLSLLTAPIRIGAKSFVGARAFILPGVSVGEGAVVGACAVVTKDVESWSVCVGNPCRVIAQRHPF